MPRTIWKFRLKITRSQQVPLHRVSKVLTVQLQNDQPTLWAMINAETEPQRKTIYCLPTGGEGPAPEWAYIGTIQLRDGTVWHFFE